MEGKPTVATHLNKMHLVHEEDLILPQTTCDQLTVSPAECDKELQRQSSAKDAPYDCLQSSFPSRTEPATP